jgi:uncharacterized protein (TIGR03086 family)
MDDKTFAAALDGFGSRLAQVGADGWDAPTPCGDWDVRALVNHVVNEVLWVAPLLAGQTIAEVGDRFDGDVVGDDPVASFVSAARVAAAAASHPGAAEQIVHLSFGDFPGSEYLAQIASDVVIHSWDLARGAGQDDALDDAVVGEVLAFLGPQVEAWRSAGASGVIGSVPIAAYATSQIGGRGPATSQSM